jgi:arabinan endo-1,5-alpha-L-arabinosidase
MASRAKRPCTIPGGRAFRRATAQSGLDGASPSRNRARPFRSCVPETEALETKLLLGQVSHGLGPRVPAVDGSRLVHLSRPQIAATGAAPWRLTGQINDVTDPSIIQEGGTYYLFSTGPGIPIRTSTNLVDWQEIGQVFTNVPGWARQMVAGATEFWAPDVVYFEGKYYLYYAVSTFGSDRSVIGLATNATLDPTASNYDWVDHGEVIASVPGRTNWNAIDPDPVVVDDSQLWLAFGSQWSGIKLTAIDPQTGMPSDRSSTPSPSKKPKLYSLASRPASLPIEAPFIFYRDGYYYLFVSFNDCCMGAASTYEIVVGRSHSITGPYRDETGKPMIEGGGTPVLQSAGSARGPGSNGVLVDDNGSDWIVYHYYDASDGGVAKLGIQPLEWTSGGWPVASAQPA